MSCLSANILAKTTALLVVTATAVGQTVDPDLWGGGVTNPSGDQAVPMVVYETETGILYLNTLGINQINETITGDLIGGDDVGVISISVSGPSCANEVLLNGYIDQSIGGVVVNGMCFGLKQQLFGVAAGAEYLQPSPRLEVFRYDGSFGRQDFGSVEIAVNFQEGMPGAAMFGQVQITAGLSMDFNADGTVDCQDVDQLTAAINAGPFDDNFDVNADGLLDSSDLTSWLEIAGRRHFGAPLIPGDADLNGSVDTRDFHIWNAHRFQQSTSYCSGNFNADHVIDVSDFNIWVAQKYQDATNTATVPEPTSVPGIAGRHYVSPFAAPP